MKRLRQLFAKVSNVGLGPTSTQDATGLDNGHRPIITVNGRVQYIADKDGKVLRSHLTLHEGRPKPESQANGYIGVDDIIISDSTTSRSEISIGCGIRNVDTACSMNIVQVNKIANASKIYSINIATGDGSTFTLTETGKILQYNIYRPLPVATEVFHASMLDSGVLSFGGKRGYVKNSGIIMKCDIFDADLLSSGLFDLKLRSTGARDPIVKVKFWNRIPNLQLKINGGAISLPVSEDERFNGPVSCQTVILRAPIVVFLKSTNYPTFPINEKNGTEEDSPNYNEQLIT